MARAEQEQPPTKQQAKSRMPTYKTVEDEAAFWDTHDLTEFEDELGEVTDVKFVKARPKKKGLTVRLEQETLTRLTQQAREKGMGRSTLVRMWFWSGSEAPRNSPHHPKGSRR